MRRRTQSLPIICLMVFGNILDLASVGLAYRSQPRDENWNPNADVSNDDKIKIFDFAAVGLNCGRSYQTFES